MKQLMLRLGSFIPCVLLVFNTVPATGLETNPAASALQKDVLRVEEQAPAMIGIRGLQEYLALLDIPHEKGCVLPVGIDKGIDHHIDPGNPRRLDHIKSYYVLFVFTEAYLFAKRGLHNRMPERLMVGLDSLHGRYARQQDLGPATETRKNVGHDGTYADL